MPPSVTQRSRLVSAGGHGLPGERDQAGARLRSERSGRTRMPRCDRVLVVAVAGTRSLVSTGYLVRVKMKSYSEPTGLPVAWSSMEPSAPVYLPVPPVTASVVSVPSS